MHDHDPNCLFCRITKGEIPSRKVYEDEDVFAFHDIHPGAPIHFLMVPKKHIPSMAQVQAEDAPLLGRLMAQAHSLQTVPQRLEQLVAATGEIALLELA